MESELSNIDEKLFLFFNGAHSAFLDHLMLAATNLLSSLPALLLVWLMIFRYYKKSDSNYPLATSLLFITLALLVFVLCKQILDPIFSEIVQREKPCLNPRIAESVHLVGEKCFGRASYFSPRVCITCSILSFLFFIVRNGFQLMKGILIIWVIIVSYSRIYVGAHYPFNVLITAVVGILMGYICSLFYYYIKNRVLLL